MTTSEADELQLWQRAIEHDGRAFAGIFDLHRDRVFRHVLRLVDGIHDAEDVTAAAFFELWRRQASVRIVDGSVLPWLLVTASNLARNARRSTRRYRAILDAAPRSPEAGTSHPSADEPHRIESVLRALPAIDSALIVLTVLEGYSTAQAAAAVGLTDGAARVRLHRARTRLRAKLGVGLQSHARTADSGTALETNGKLG